MCGIAGAFSPDDKDMNGEVKGRLARLRHRGYRHFEMDGGPGWAIGANRLEILDREHGRQPKYSHDRRVIAVLNGEIYNYHSLKHDLIAEGCVFESDTDTEVIAQGYRMWGEDLFARLDGMFALILWDAAERTFTVARDPVGVKPLYYVHDGLQVLFASEVKALLGCELEIQEVPPGHAMTGWRMDVLSYDRRKPCLISENLDENAAILRTLISEAVRKRVQTDLPVAVFLSGGIDSSVVLYEAACHHPDVTGFSIGLLMAEDVTAARNVCNELGVPHVHVPVTEQNLLELIPETVWTIESFEPNHIRGGTLSYLLAKAVSNAGYRVALCGEGADELFGGYREFGLAVASRSDDRELHALFVRFLGELHRTQLQRVDRTAMRFTLEVRVPFLDKQILDLSAALPVEHKVALQEDGTVGDKRVLRAAYRGLLPNWVIKRPKVVLSLGAGFGSNGQEGPFYENGQRQVSEAELDMLRVGYPIFDLRTREEAYYFKVYLDRFGPLSLGQMRPLVNATPVNV